MALNMKPRLIIEGFDNTGKSTIAAALSKQYNTPVFKNKLEGRLFRGVGINYYHNLQIATPTLIQFMEDTWGTLDGIIFDRFLPSEYAYSQAYGRQTDLDLIWEFDKQLANLGFSLIICYKPNILNFTDDLVKVEMNSDVTRNFLKYSFNTRMPTLVMNTSDENTDEQVKIITGWLEKNYYV